MVITEQDHQHLVVGNTHSDAQIEQHWYSRFLKEPKKEFVCIANYTTCTMLSFVPTLLFTRITELLSCAPTLQTPLACCYFRIGVFFFLLGC